MAASGARRVWWQRLGLGAVIVLIAMAPVIALGSPAQAASQSWKAKRTESFSGSGLPNGCHMFEGKYDGGKSAWSSKNVKVSGGQLKLSIEKRKVSGRAYASGGIGCWDWAQKYGKYEIRAKVPQGKGVDSYFGLWPEEGTKGSAWTGVELLAPDAETAYITNGYGKEAQPARVLGNYSNGFHTYLIEWAPKYLRITMDGDELFFSTKSYDGRRWPGFVTSNGDPLTGVPDASTKLPATFLIDRIKTFSYTGVQPTLRSETPADANTKATPTVTASVPAVESSEVPLSAAVTSAAAAPGSSTALAGGVWPWLLGGSLIAASAVLILNYPRHRAHQKQLKQAQARGRDPARSGPRGR